MKLNNIKFLTPGLLTTIQDKGRASMQQLGIPACGAMDPLAMDVANLLVGNFNNEAVLECTFSGPKIEFNSNSLIAIAGAEVNAKLNGYNVDNYMTIEVKKGDVLDLTIFNSGMRAYIAFSGGIAVPNVLGSKATYLPMQFGENDKKIKINETLPIGEIKYKRFFKINKDNSLRFSKEKIQRIRIVKGPQYDYFSKDEIDKLVDSPYKISDKSDRMGLRLIGKEITTDSEDMISDGIPFGSIQITRGGQPIIMAADRQPTGGYPKIAKIILSDIHHLGQLAPSDKIKFDWIDIAMSKEIYLNQRKEFENLKQQYFNREITTKTYRMYIKNNMYQTSLVEK
jgi:biotin-dependent carboxylase-like uncharacterized protein